MPQVPPLNTNYDIDPARADFNALRNQRMQFQNAMLPRQFQLEERQMAVNEKALGLREELIDIQRQAEARANDPGPISIDLDDLTIKGDPDKVAYVAAMSAQYPDQVEDPGWPAWVASQGVTLERRKDESAAPTELEKLINAMDALPPDDPRRQFYQNRIAKISQATGTVIRQTPDGGFEIIQGAPTADLQRRTAGAVEEKIVSGKEQLARMNQIYSEFKPEYQELGTRFSNAWTGAKAKLGMDIPPEDEQSLVDYKKFQRKAIENINLYIKELTGAQMSEKEADRLRLAQPDPGENWWKGDDPITFKAKMEDVLKMTRAAVARYNYYREKGLDDRQIRAIINDNTAVSLAAIAERL